MTTTSATTPEDAQRIDRELAERAVDQVRTWLRQAREEKVDSAAKNLAGVLRDPNGLAFTVGFVDRVVRPEDVRAAARNLTPLVPLTPRFLPLPLRGLIRLAGVFAPVLPGIVVPAARTVLRGMVRHLIVDARDSRLGPAISKIRGDGGDTRLNINLLGEAILGPDEAERRLAGTRRLLERSDVDYVSIKVSSTVAPHTPWAFDEAIAHAVEALAPLYRLARQRGKFINLDMEEFKDLDLTIAVFTELLGRDEFRDLEAGIVLQAYLPDALGVMIRLQEWAAERVGRGGAPIKVRVVKGANLPMEKVDAEVHGWPMATWQSKQHSDASYKAVLDYALRPERTRNVRIGVAGHNLFDIALVRLLAERRGVGSDAIDYEMLLGMATAQAAVVRRDVGSVLLYTPVVHPDEFDVAISYLVRRLEEGASAENFMSAVFDLDGTPELFEREKDRFLASIDLLTGDVPSPNRTQNRLEPQPAAPRHGFWNTPDTDPSLAPNREWAAGVRERMRTSRLGIDTLDAHRISSPADADALVETGLDAGAGWRELGPDARAEILHRAGDVLQRRRGELLEVMGSECGKVIEQSDPEVSEAIDFAHYYAESGRALVRVDGATFDPVRLTVVTPPWNFPVAIPAGSTLSALAAGSPVVLKPAKQAARCGAVLAEALWEAGVPREVLQLVTADDREASSRLVSHPRVERVVLTGAYETAELFRSMRQDLPLLAETSGKNAVIVTPSADLDLAAKDVVASAFGHAGQKCSAASLVVLVGSVARSDRFRRQLIDAAAGYQIGMPWEEGARIGPLIGPAEGKLERALTRLEPGQSWLVKPERLDEEGRLWRPGIRDGVRAGSEFHLTEYFGPVLGIMTAATLDEAIDLVNAVDYGLTSGIHALDEAEVARWLERIEAGNAYVNRGITGAIVQRQPFGGWKKSAVGAGTKAGGPSYLFGFGTWSDAPAEPAAVPLGAVGERALAAVEGEEREWLRCSLLSDADAWRTEFGVARDATGLELEQNVLRYVPTSVTVRHQDRPVHELVRIVAAGVRSGADLFVSLAEEPSALVRRYLADEGVPFAVEDGGRWAARAADVASAQGRIRLVGGSLAEIVEATAGTPALAVYDAPVVSAGRVELLPFLREQSVSITAHRFGNPQRYDIPVVAGRR